MPLTWSLTKLMQSSTKACVFEGTPGVAFRVTSHRKPKPITPRMIDITIVSKLIDQKLVLPTCFTMNVRWCWMYSDGDWYEAAIGLCGDYLRSSSAMRNRSTVITNVAKNAMGTTSL